MTGRDVFGYAVVAVTLLAWPWLDGWLRCPGDEVEDFADEWPDTFPAEWVGPYDRERNVS